LTSWLPATASIAQEVVNPLVPAWYDLAFSIIPLAFVAIAIVGLVSIVRRYSAMSTFDSVMWTAFVVFAPIVGTLVWFVLGRKHYTTASSRAE
jgi:hypothetical protein